MAVCDALALVHVPKGVDGGASKKSHVKTYPIRLLVVSVSLVSLGLLGQPVHAQESAESICTLPEDERPDELVEPVELCAETTLRASNSKVLRVTLPTEVELAGSFGPDGAIEIEGQGPFVGFVLTEDLPERDGRLILAGRLHREPSPSNTFRLFGGVDHPGFDGTLPAGNYRLYVLATGSPVVVTLRFPELAGWVDVTPSTPNGFDSRSLEPRIWEEGGRLVYSAGEDGELRTRGLLLASIWINATDHTATDYGFCIHHGPSDPASFLPECPHPEEDNWAFGPLIEVPPRATNVSGALVFRGQPPGTYGLGAWYATVSQVSSTGSVVFWLDLE